MRSIVSELVRQERLIVVDEITMETHKTKELVTKLKSLALDNVLLVTDSVDQNLYLAARNLINVQVCDVAAVDPVSLIGHEKVVMTAGAIKIFEEWLA